MNDRFKCNKKQIRTEKIGKHWDKVKINKKKKEKKRLKKIKNKVLEDLI